MRGDVATPRLRPLEDDDIAEVLALNERNVVWLAPLPEQRLREIHGVAHRFDVIDLGGRAAGFVVTMAPGAAYDSENFRWFQARYGEDFLYLDRIVVHEDFRRSGLAGRVYDVVETEAVPRGRLALEVKLVPRNEPSLLFHQRRGYVEVGRLGDAAHQVSLQAKELSCVTA